MQLILRSVGQNTSHLVSKLHNSLLKHSYFPFFYSNLCSLYNSLFAGMSDNNIDGKPKLRGFSARGRRKALEGTTNVATADVHHDDLEDTGNAYFPFSSYSALKI